MRLQLDNARIVHGSIRKFVIQRGSFDSVDEGKINLSSVDQQQRKLGYGIDAEAAKKTWSFSAFLKFGRNKEVDHTRSSNNENTTRTVEEVRLFGDFEQDTIGFGDRDFGDVRREYGFLA
ncbi:hypothetical protein [Sphingomonas sp. M1-B02]|uniref:hypothetical protein n=1 Tax=Sphingomonas sp. M1-B02 TaxID=3114300 RepID=UPI00223EDDCC|nr:hypothetical protein [Sphingomonas sp. S6-11]UZK66839.1 hypothetical protein OKW87_03090 [Sphingomonas sp. S6-11]